MEVVEARLGRPQISRRIGDREIWVYRNNVRITFEHGVVIADPNHPAPAAAGPAPASLQAQGEGESPPPAPSEDPSATPAAAPASGGNVTYRDAARHIRFDLPRGFERIQSSDPAIFAGWARAAEAGRGPQFVALAELAGTLPRGPFPQNKLPSGRTVSMVPWRGEMLNCVRVEEKLADGILVNLNLLLPTGAKILRLTFAGPVAEEAAVRKLMTETLATLDVALVYAPAASDRLAERLGELTGVLATAAIAFLVVRRFRKKSAG